MSDKPGCPICGYHVYEGSFKGTRVWKCANPMSNCPLNQEWHDEHGEDEYRAPIGKNMAQVRRVNDEFTKTDKEDYQGN